MHLLPCARFDFGSRLTATELEHRLSEQLRPRRTLLNFWKVPDRPLEGDLSSDNKFKLQRVIRGRNSFLPVVIGEIYSNESGTGLRGSLRLNLLIAGFMAIWLSGAFVILLAAIAALIGVGWTATTQGLLPALLIPPVLLAAGYGMMHGFFGSEAKRALGILKEIAGEPPARSI